MILFWYTKHIIPVFLFKVKKGYTVGVNENGRKGDFRQKEGFV